MESYPCIEFQPTERRVLYCRTKLTLVMLMLRHDIDIDIDRAQHHHLTPLSGNYIDMMHSCQARGQPLTTITLLLTSTPTSSILPIT